MAEKLNIPKIRIKNLSSQAFVNLPMKPKNSRTLDFETSGRERNYGDASQGLELVTLGLDFGTSSIKASLFFREKVFLIPLCEGHTLDAFLLPSKMWKDDSGVFNLQGRGVEIEKIKLRLLQEPESENNQIEAAAFLTLVLREIRKSIFKFFAPNFIDFDLVWRLAIGLPSVGVANLAAQKWKEIFHCAWAVSRMDYEVAEPILHYVLNQGREAARWNEDDRVAEINVIPEVSAEIFSMIDSVGSHQDKQPYFLVDVGAGTVDIAVLYFSKNPANWAFSTTICFRKVLKFGATFCHGNRVKTWRDALREYSERTGSELASQLIDDLGTGEILSPLLPLPESAKDYLRGVVLSRYEDPDVRLDLQLQKYLQPAYEKASGLRSAEAPVVRILPAGGGGASEIYLKTLRKMRGSRFSLSEEFYPLRSIQMPEGYSLTTKQVWTRFAVSYGLAKGVFDEAGIPQGIPSSKVRRKLAEDDSVYDVIKPWQVIYTK